MITIALVLMTALTADAANLRSNAGKQVPEGGEKADADEEPEEAPMPPRQPGDTRGPWSHTGEPIGEEAVKPGTYNPYADAQPARQVGQVDWKVKFCLDGWTHNNVTDHCYKRMASAPFDAAMLDCSHQPVMCVNCPWAHIAVPNNVAEGKWLWRLTGGGSGALWVGYNRAGYARSTNISSQWADLVTSPVIPASNSADGPWKSQQLPTASLPLIKLKNSNGKLSAVSGSTSGGLRSFAYICESLAR